jgi:hypothetical protein
MGCADTMPRALPSNIPSAADYFFLAARAPELAVTAVRMSLKATSSIFSPSRKSIARRKFRDEISRQEAVKKSTGMDPIRNYCLRVVAARLRW